MHLHRIIACHEVNIVAMAREQLVNPVILFTPQHGGTRNLVPIQMQNGQHGPITHRVQKINALPGAFERSSLCFPIPNHGCDDHIWIVESCAKGVGQDVAQFASFVNGARRGHTDVAGNTSRGRELAEQAAYPIIVLCDLRINLRVGPFQVHIRDNRRSTVPWPCQVDHIGILIPDESI